MKNKYSLREVESAIDKILTIIDSNYKTKTQKIGFDEIFSLMKDLYSLFNTYTEIDYKKCSNQARRRYIPILNLLLNIDNSSQRRVVYYAQLENAYKLAARYDFESFVIYYEWEETDKFYEPRYEILGSYAYYLDKMAKDPDMELIIANLPSGAGKTYLEKLAEAFSYGLDDTGTILSLCSNDDVVKGGSRTVRDIIKNERFGDVFPNKRYAKENRSYFLKETEGEWKLKNCKLSASYYAKTTNSNVIGVRASKWIHIDDLYAGYKEALDEQMNIYYYNQHVTVWRKRFVQGKKPKIVITGTMWSPTDFIVRIIELYKSREAFVKHPKFKYTWISLDEKKVIIQVPALDMETGESSCKALWKTEDLILERDSMDAYLWETNFQQNPTTPEALEFDYKNLRTYDTKPINEYGSTISAIDGTRKSGKDFFAMPILQPYGDDYALIDCIYTKVATSELFDDIVDKIIEHNIKLLVVETNVDGGLKKVIEEKLKERGFNNGIQIIEKYSTVVKATRIELEKGNIKSRIVFPARGMYGLNTHMGRFMQSFTIYNSQGRNEHDDANDCLAEVTSEIISGKAKSQKVKIIKRPF
jgi:predicted phage terminase large subunit-like protein